MQFKQIIGQQQAISQLISAVQSDRLPHAQIFLGPQGAGGLSLALAFAQFVLCSNPSESDSCGTCPACTKSTKFIHPDVHFSFPTVGSKMVSTNFYKEWRTALTANPYLNINQWLQAILAENKQGNITRDECVSIVKKLSFKTFEGSHKVLIMWLPEYLGKEGNRLLKLIEEPPENTLFILVAENQELILNTILSRCQILKVNKINDVDMISALQENHGLSEPEASRIAFLTNGNLNEAITLIGSLETDNSASFLEWFRLCFTGRPAEMLKWTAEFSTIGRENQKQFIRYGLNFLREYLLIKTTGNTDVRLQPNELATANKMTKVIEFHQIEQINALLNDCYYYIERNANVKVLFLDASIQLNKILKNKAYAKQKA